MNLVFPKGRRILPLPGESQRVPVTPPPQMPPLFTQAQNFAGAVVRNVESLTAGNPLKVTDATRDARQAKCTPCKWNVQDRCAHPKCGCPTTVRRLLLLKTELFAEFCPDDPQQWGPGEIEHLAAKSAVSD